MPVARRHSLRQLAPIASALMATLAGVGAADDARAADVSSQVTMRISPETAALSPEGVARVIVVLDNAGGKRLRDVEVSIVEPAALSSKPKRIGPLTIRPGERQHCSSRSGRRPSARCQQPLSSAPGTKFVPLGRQDPLKQILVASLAVASHEA